ncbi:MAG: hypothetical protein R3D88_09345 [Alphaproteobacteria bacterium]|mgnify:CR=1 FL=1|nr:hypothetical protein [Alphaproteobacteria bacterium]
MKVLEKIPFNLQLLLAFIIAFGVITYQSREYEPQLRTGDSYIYLSTAKGLIDKGVLTNGTFSETFPEEGKNGEGLFFTPIYPAFLASIMKFDQKFYNDASCHINSIGTQSFENCGNYYDSVIIAQTFLGALTAFFIMLTAFLMTKNLALSWTAFAIGLMSGIYGQYATEIMTEAVLFPLFALANLFIVLGWKYRKSCKRSALMWFLAGLFLGLTTLTRPAYAYVVYIGIFFIYFLYFLVSKDGFKKSFRFPLILALGFSIITSAWVIRNGIATGEYVISKGYGPYILIQRLAYNDMTWKEWGVSFLYYLPDFGDKLASSIFNEQNYKRFDYGNQNGFFYIGHTTLREKITKEVESADNLMNTAINNYLIPNFTKHTVVTFSMLFNGIWIGKYWALITFPMFLFVLWTALKHRWYEFVILAFPGIFMWGFHAFTSVNVTRYNMVLVPCLSFATAWVLFELIKTIKNISKES